MSLSESHNKILNIFLKALIAFSLVIPLLFFKEFFYPFVTGKVLIFRSLVELSLILVAVMIFSKSAIDFKGGVIWKWFLGLTLIIFLAGVFGVNPYNSFWSNVERAEGSLFWIHLLAYLTVLIFIFRSKKDFKLLFRVSLITATVAIVYGLMQTYGILGAVTTSGSRMSSTLGNAAYLGSYLLMNFFIAFYLLVSGKNVYWKGFYSVFMLLATIAIFMTQTRGAILGLIGGLLLVAVLSALRSQHKNIKISAGIFIVTVLILLGGVFVFSDSAVVQSSGALRRISTISFNDYTTQTRIRAWISASNGFVDRPILGWGSENYNYAFSKYFPPEIYTDSGSRLWFDKAHSIFFEFLVTTGVLGVIAYFGLLVLLVLKLFKTKNLTPLQSNIFIGLLAGYTFANLFVFDTVNTYILFAVLLAFINLVSQKSNEDGTNIVNSNDTKLVKGVVGLILLVFVFTFYSINYQNTISNKKLFKAEVSAKTGDIETAYQNYLATITGNTDPTRFESRRAFALFVLASASQLPDYKASEMFDSAIEAILSSIEEDPNDIRHYYNLSQLYLKSSKYDVSRLDKVIDMGDTMVSLGESRAHTYYQIGEAYFRKNNYDAALVEFQKAVELNPDVVDPYINVYSIAILTDNQELVDFAENNMTRIHPDYFEREETLLRFIPLYKQAGLNDRVITDLQKLIEINPSKIDYIVSLATIYAELGRNQDAKDVISQLLGLDDKLDVQLNDFIGKIDSGYFLKK